MSRVQRELDQFGSDELSGKISVAGELIVCEANWCPDCRRAKQFLGSHRLPYRWVDLEQFPEGVAEAQNLRSA